MNQVDLPALGEVVAAHQIAIVEAVGLHIRQEEASRRGAIHRGDIKHPGGFPVADIGGDGIALAVGGGHRAAIDLGPALFFSGDRVHLPDRGLLAAEAAVSGAIGQ